jgi:hypothetical protein
LLHIDKENVGVGGLFDGHGCDDAARAHGTQNGQYLPVALRRIIMNARAAKTPRIEPGHLRGNPAFIQINQAIVWILSRNPARRFRLASVSRSVAWSDFFKPQPESAHQTRHRAQAEADLRFLVQLRLDLGQGQVGALPNQFSTSRSTSAPIFRLRPGRYRTRSA